MTAEAVGWAAGAAAVVVVGVASRHAAAAVAVVLAFASIEAGRCAADEWASPVISLSVPTALVPDARVRAAAAVHLAAASGAVTTMGADVHPAVLDAAADARVTAVATEAFHTALVLTD